MRLRTMVTPSVIFSVLFFTAGFAQAEPQTHDGFYLRMHLGAGDTSLETNTSPKTTIEGSGGGGGLSLGYMVIQNLGLFLEISGSTIAAPEYRSGDNSLKLSEGVEVSVGGLGFGAIYYFMPINMYISGALVTDTIDVLVPGYPTSKSDEGGGISLMVGKEWWVSDNWGLGVAAALRSSVIEDGADNNVEWTASSFNIVFSATYN